MIPSIALNGIADGSILISPQVRPCDEYTCDVFKVPINPEESRART